MNICCVILNYNDYETTVKLLLKIRGYETITHIVIVDNKSLDESFQIFKQYETHKIHVIQSDKNGGYGYGNNYGIRYSCRVLKADYILIANPDVIFTEDCIIKMKNALINNADFAAAAPVMKNPKGQISKTIAWKLPTVKQDVLQASIVFDRIIRNKMYYDPEYFKDKKMCSVECIPGSLLMVNSEIMIDFGMYDEAFFLFGEEKLLGYKFKNQGYKTVLLLDCDYIHNHSVTIDKNLHSEFTKKRIFLSSKLIFLKKYKRVSGFKLLLIKVFFAYTLLEILIISFFKKLKYKDLKHYSDL